MWFDSLASMGTIALKAALGFVVLLAFLRLSGKRSLARLNAFDLVLLFSVGSVLATLTLSDSTPVADGVAALAVLFALQWLTAFGAVRFPAFRKLVKSEPALLVHDGRMLPEALRAECLAPLEVEAVLREAGVHALDEVAAVVLETDGSFSVIRRGQGERVRVPGFTGRDWTPAAGTDRPQD